MAQSNYNWPINPTTVNSGPIQFEVDGAPTTVNIDTVTPANSTPLPVRLYDSSGNILAFNNDYGASSGALRTAAQIGNATGAADFGVGATGAQTLRVEANSATLATEATLGQIAINTEATSIILNEAATGVQPLSVSATSLPLPTGAATEATLLDVRTNTSDTATNTADILTEVDAINNKLGTLGQKTMAGSAPVVIASDQSVIPVSPSAGASGSSPGSSTVSTVATITAPANALGFILMNLDTSTTNMRYRIGATATASSGQQLQPGRDTGYIPCGANISIIAESGTVAYDIQWVVR